jgi:hypothetical protein
MRCAGGSATVPTFDQVGAGQWLRYATATLESAGGIGPLLPLVGLATLRLVGIMAGAVLSEMLLLENGNPSPRSSCSHQPPPSPGSAWPTSALPSAAAVPCDHSDRPVPMNVTRPTVACRLCGAGHRVRADHRALAVCAVGTAVFIQIATRRPIWEATPPYAGPPGRCWAWWWSVCGPNSPGSADQRPGRHRREVTGDRVRAEDA